MQILWVPDRQFAGAQALNRFDPDTVKQAGSLFSHHFLPGRTGRKQFYRILNLLPLREYYTRLFVL